MLTVGGAACGDSKKDNTSASKSTTSTAKAAAVPTARSSSRPAPTTPTQNAVAVLQYMPAKATVAVGQTVRWSWNGTIEPHSVTFFPPGQSAPPAGQRPDAVRPTPPTGAYDGTTLVNSGLGPAGPAAVPPFEITFAKAGTYNYPA